MKCNTNTNNIKPQTDLPSKRLLSVDALRGFDMFWIIGGGWVLKEICDAWPNTFTRFIHKQFTHVQWQGFHFYDMIFPLFMLIMGLVLPYSFSKRRRQGQTNKQILSHILKRSFILVIVGLIYEGILKFNWPDFRWSSVLGLIGTSYCLAAVILLYTSIRTQFILFIAILLGYWAILQWVDVQTVRDAATVVYGGGDYSIAHNLISYLDQQFIPGKHPYGEATNGVGPFLSFTGACSVMIGIFAGHWLRSRHSENKKFLGLIAAALLCIGLGTLWGFAFPIIKLIWTSSFVLVAGGYSLLLFALFYYIIDVKKCSRGTLFMVVIGMNPITIYLLQNFVNFGDPANKLFGGIIQYTGQFEPIFAALGVLLLKWLFLYWLFRKKIFLRF